MLECCKPSVLMCCPSPCSITADLWRPLFRTMLSERFLGHWGSCCHAAALQHVWMALGDAVNIITLKTTQSMKHWDLRQLPALGYQLCASSVGNRDLSFRPLNPRCLNSKFSFSLKRIGKCPFPWQRLWGHRAGLWPQHETIHTTWVLGRDVKGFICLQRVKADDNWWMQRKIVFLDMCALHKQHLKQFLRAVLSFLIIYATVQVVLSLMLNLFPSAGHRV